MNQIEAESERERESGERGRIDSASVYQNNSDSVASNANNCQGNLCNGSLRNAKENAANTQTICNLVRVWDRRN